MQIAAVQPALTLQREPFFSGEQRRPGLLLPQPRVHRCRTGTRAAVVTFGEVAAGGRRLPSSASTARAPGLPPKNF